MKVMELGPFWKKGTQSIAAGCNTWYWLRYPHTYWCHSNQLHLVTGKETGRWSLAKNCLLITHMNTLHLRMLHSSVPFMKSHDATGEF